MEETSPCKQCIVDAACREECYLLIEFIEAGLIEGSRAIGYELGAQYLAHHLRTRRFYIDGQFIRRKNDDSIMEILQNPYKEKITW